MRHPQEEAQARLNKLFRRKLEAAKAKEFQRTHVGRREIVKEVPGLKEDEAVELSLKELKADSIQWTA
jgi:hypothetical protein